jgi:molybdopterin molybdotransferase
LDGYAVRGDDTLHASEDHPVTLKVIGKIYAGEVFSGEVARGECVRLMTGAPIPRGADSVIRQEDTDNPPVEKEDLCDRSCDVKIYKGVAPWQNYCYAGEDYRQDDILLRKGDVLSGMTIGVAAGAGREKVLVYRKPVVSVISTGDELMSPGERLLPGKIYDSNLFLVAGRLKDLGLTDVRFGRCVDDASAMGQRIREAAGYSDLIITTGGVSVGEKDIMHQVPEDLKGEKLFWKVAMKPGGVTLAFLYERESDKIPVVCLTGNPYGVAANFELLLRPMMEKLTGNPSWKSKRLLCRLENDSPKRGGRRRYLRGHIEEETRGERRVRILDGSHASGTLSTMAACNCLVEIPENGSGRAGEYVTVYVL